MLAIHRATAKETENPLYQTAAPMTPFSGSSPSTWKIPARSTSRGKPLSAKVGRLPDFSLLHTRLQPGVSTTDQVLAQLGPPFGRGSIFHETPRESIYYYYEEGTAQDNHRAFLFIFLKDNHYDGYMWFSNIPHLLPPSPPAYHTPATTTSSPSPH